MQDTASVQTDSLGTVLERAAGQLADSIGADAAHIVEAIKSPSWWEIASSLAIIAVAVLAGIELWRIYRNRKESEKRAAARVSAVAFPVRRQIKSWLDELPPGMDQMEGRLQKPGQDWSQEDATAVHKLWQYWNLRSVKGDIGKAETRIEAMSAEAPFAEEKVRAGVVGSTRLFYRAFDKINKLAAQQWENAGDKLLRVAKREYGVLISEGHKRLKQCAEELDALVDK